MTCNVCHADTPADAAFCQSCGHSLLVECGSCGTQNAADHRFCKHCGGSLQTEGDSSPGFLREPVQKSRDGQRTVADVPAKPIPATKRTLEGERKQVTVLFCDLVGSTAMAEHIGPDAMHSLLDRFFAMALEEVQRFEGTINQFLGDGFMALFGAPIACEDHARAAVMAALEIQKALDQRRGEFTAQGSGLHARIGINTGMVVVGRLGKDLRMDYTAIGDTSNLAARLEQFAKPDTVYVSARTYGLARPHFEWRSLGSHKLKGKSKPVEVYQALGMRARDEARKSPIWGGCPLMGRDEELASLIEVVEQAAAGRGGIACVLGEAGLGKTRLKNELRGALTQQPVLWLEGEALSFGQRLSYWPFREMVQNWVGVEEEESESESFAKLSRRVEALFPDKAEEVLPYLAQLLGLDLPPEFEERVKYLSGQALGAQIFRSIHRWVETLTQQQPLVLVFEDLHWMDQSSTELIEHLLPLTETAPLLLLGLGRLDSQSPAIRLRELCQERYADQYREIRLASLDDEAVAGLLGNLLGEGELTRSVLDLARMRADGNPLYIEEIVNTLLVAGGVEQDPKTGRWTVVQQLDEMAVPETVQGVIMARIDRLGEDLKEVLKVASVIGRTFLRRIIDQVAEMGATLNTHLSDLCDVDLIRLQHSVPEIEYIFKHALVQEATYNSILVDRRRQLHRRVGESIESLFAGRLERYYGFLAHHFALGEDWEKAQHYLFLQGDQAVNMAADTEALLHYREAMEAYARAFGDQWDSQERARLEAKLGDAMYARGDHQQALAYYQRALAHFGARYPGSKTALRLEILRQLLLQVLHRILPLAFVSRQVGAADSPAAERTRIYAQMGWMHYFVDPEHNVLDVLLVLNTAEKYGLESEVARGSMGVGVFFELIGLRRIGRGYHRRALSLAKQTRHSRALADARMGLTWHYYFQARWGPAIEHLQKAIEGYRNIGDVRGCSATSGMMIILCRFCGRFDLALRAAEDIIQMGRESGDDYVRGWGWQGLGYVKSHIGPLDEAEVLLEQALEIYPTIPAPASAAEAASDLARCLLRRGEVDAAVALLEKHDRVLIEQGTLTSEAVYPFNMLAEAYLAKAERCDGKEKARFLKLALKTSRRALRQCRIHPAAVAWALRLCGTQEWLRGRESQAMKYWQRGIKAGERLDTPLFVAQIYREIGRRTASRSALEQAQAVFSRIGAKVDWKETQRLLENA